MRVRLILSPAGYGTCPHRHPDERTTTVPNPDPKDPTPPDGPMADPQTHLDTDPVNDPDDDS